jgi:outer membrane protein assembly factor BamB
MPSTRRSFLAGGAAAASSALLAGCASLSGDSSPDDPPPSGDVSLGERDRHVYGATGDWSSFGANAANNREVADGRAPVDGVTEQWRVPFPQLSYQEPVVVDGTVYATTRDRLRALDAETGDERWSADGADAPPLVLDGVVYAARSRPPRACSSA